MTKPLESEGSSIAPCRLKWHVESKRYGSWEYVTGWGTVGAAKRAMRGYAKFNPDVPYRVVARHVVARSKVKP